MMRRSVDSSIKKRFRTDILIEEQVSTTKSSKKNKKNF